MRLAGRGLRTAMARRMDASVVAFDGVASTADRSVGSEGGIGADGLMPLDVPEPSVVLGAVHGRPGPAGAGGRGRDATHSAAGICAEKAKAKMNHAWDTSAPGSEPPLDYAMTCTSTQWTVAFGTSFDSSQDNILPAGRPARAVPPRKGARPPPLPGSPATPAWWQRDLEGEWHACGERCGAFAWSDAWTIRGGTITDALGERHRLEYGARGPCLYGGPLLRRGELLVWRSKRGERTYARHAEEARGSLMPPFGALVPPPVEDCDV